MHDVLLEECYNLNLSQESFLCRLDSADRVVEPFIVIGTTVSTNIW